MTDLQFWLAIIGACACALIASGVAFYGTVWLTHIASRGTRWDMSDAEIDLIAAAALIVFAGTLAALVSHVMSGGPA